LAAGSRSLEDAFKRRSVVGVTEAHRELSISLEKFKASLLESMGGRALASSLKRVWVNKAEHIYQDILEQAGQFRGVQSEPARGPGGVI
jgi:hypothetical protein